jgi:uncharacterized protein with PQ loop repeat
VFSLSFYWPALAGTFLLLFFPPSLWLQRRVLRYLSEPGSAGEFKLWRGAQVWQNWLDLLRGAAGAYLLVFVAFEAEEDQEWSRLGWIISILLVALLIQTIRRYRERTFFLAPIFFLWGVTLAIAGPFLAFYGILASVLVGNVASNLEWKLPVMFVVIGVAGYFVPHLGPGLPLLSFNLVAILFPLIVSFCGRGRLVFLMPEEKRR